jgi:prolipoprotein diacylglyceryltransferase
MPVWATLDALEPLLGTLGVGVGLMHLAAGTAFGKPGNVPWAIELWNAARHPSQVYETVLALAILLFTWFLKERQRPGILFLLFVSLSAGARLFLEAFRGDSVLLSGGFRQAQIGAWIVLALCFYLFEVVEKRTETSMERG